MAVKMKVMMAVLLQHLAGLMALQVHTPLGPSSRTVQVCFLLYVLHKAPCRTKKCSLDLTISLDDNVYRCVLKSHHLS